LAIEFERLHDEAYSDRMLACHASQVSKLVQLLRDS
jgi:hypothetical protein